VDSPVQKLTFGAVAIAVLFPLASCTASSGPASPTVAPSASASPDSTPAPSLTALDPCAVLTDQQRRQLEVYSPPQALSAPASATDSKRSCSYSQPGLEPAENYVVTLASQASMESYLHDSGLAATDKFSTSDKPGVLARKTGQEVSCNALVEVASQQVLDVQFASLAGHSGDTDTLCAKAKEGANLAVQTILAYH
jgi:Protein of unknown function (DUF3558)